MKYKDAYDKYIESFKKYDERRASAEEYKAKQNLLRRAILFFSSDDIGPIPNSIFKPDHAEGEWVLDDKKVKAVREFFTKYANSGDCNGLNSVMQPEYFDEFMNIIS